MFCFDVPSVPTKNPEGQGRQIELPCNATVPLGHGKHEAAAANEPESTLNVPDGQRAQADAPRIMPMEPVQVRV